MKEEEVQRNYRALLGKIKEQEEKQLSIYSQEIQCRLGCDSCCRPPDSLFLIEAKNLEEGISKIDKKHKDIIQLQLEEYQAKERELCPILFEGRCLSYENRPSICRTHGYAVWIGEEEKLSWCPLNFQGEKPKKEMAFDIDRLNQMMALITKLAYPDEEGRRPLVEVIRQGLEL